MAKQLYCTEIFINATKGCMYHEDTKPQEAFTTDLGRLYRNCVREYGRCTGRVYAELVDGTSIPVGWVFVKRVEYDDPMCRRKPESYLREVWLTVYNRIDSEGNPYDNDYDYDDEPTGVLPTFRYHRP